MWESTTIPRSILSLQALVMSPLLCCHVNYYSELQVNFICLTCLCDQIKMIRNLPLEGGETQVLHQDVIRMELVLVLALIIISCGSPPGA